MIEMITVYICPEEKAHQVPDGITMREMFQYLKIPSYDCCGVVYRKVNDFELHFTHRSTTLIEDGMHISAHYSIGTSVKISGNRNNAHFCGRCGRCYDFSNGDENWFLWAVNGESGATGSINSQEEYLIDIHDPGHTGLDSILKYSSPQ